MGKEDEEGNWQECGTIVSRGLGKISFGPCLPMGCMLGTRRAVPKQSSMAPFAAEKDGDDVGEHLWFDEMAHKPKGE